MVAVLDAAEGYNMDSGLPRDFIQVAILQSLDDLFDCHCVIFSVI